MGLIRKIMATFGVASRVTKAKHLAESYVQFVEEEELSSSLLKRLQGVEDRTRILEEYKTRYEVMLNDLISSWNSSYSRKIGIRGLTTDRMRLEYVTSITNHMYHAEKMVLSLYCNNKLVASQSEIYSHVVHEPKNKERIYKKMLDEVIALGLNTLCAKSKPPTEVTSSAFLTGTTTKHFELADLHAKAKTLQDEIHSMGYAGIQVYNPARYISNSDIFNTSMNEDD